MAMDHDYIQKHQVVDRYVMGRLTAAEADLFEDHYLTCDECLQRLRVAEKFQRGFRQVAAEEASGLLAILAAAFRSRRFLVGGLAFLLLFAVFILLGLRSLRLEQDLESVRARLAEAEKRGAVEARKATAAERERETLQARLAAEKSAVEEALKGERESRRPPIAGLWLVTLVPVRTGPAADQPFQQITFPKGVERVVLEPDLDLAGTDSYKVTLRRRDGAAVWTAAGLRPGPTGTLALGIDPALLQPGDYRLLIESQPGGGSALPAGRFSFRIVR